MGFATHRPLKRRTVAASNIRSIGLIFLVGAWIGLIVIDGATYLLLVLILVCGYALPHANALKVLLKRCC